MPFAFRRDRINNNNAAVLMVARVALPFKVESPRCVPRRADAFAQGVSSAAWNLRRLHIGRGPENADEIRV
jgi:hypothetical protein